MTHYYLYIHCGASLSEDSRFYKVAIGQSSRETKFFTYLESYALEHGHYFVLWDADAIEFLKKCLDSINGTLSQVIIVNGADFVKSLKENAPVPYSLNANLQRHDLLRRIDAAYYATCMLRRKK